MKNNKQQTAVEWLEQEMLKPNLSMKEILKQAKKMEKEQSEKYAEYVLELFKKDTNPMSFNLWNETYGDEEQ